MAQLEDELHTAARLGKDLLDRHDKYIKQVEQERASFLAEIERQNAFAKMVDALESNNRALEVQNQESMRENLALLKRLEALNSSLDDADTQNEQLRTNLDEAEHEVGKLSQRAVKATVLEQQMMDAQLERDVLAQDLATASNSTMASVGRVRQAEQKNKELERKLEELEQQGSTLPNTPKVEIPCQGTPKMITRDVPTVSTESAALDQLISNNASLEKHNADLLRVLANSQDEIVFLRQQLQRHQEDSIALKDADDDEKAPRRTVSQELHRHHHYHYHVPSKTAKMIKRDSRSKDSLSVHKRDMSKPVIDGRSGDRLSAHESDTVTPLRRHNTTGLCSPPTTKNRRHRDSGYFSFASEDSTRGRSNSLKQPMSPFIDTFTDSYDTSTPIRAHLRSSSHESVFIPQEFVLPLKDELQLVAEDKIALPALRHSTSHESVFEPIVPSTTCNLLLAKTSVSKRPYPAPLQNCTSFATVSMASATAYNSPSHIGSESSPRSNSYKALRNAAAAQKLSPSTQTPSPSSTTQFWRRNSDKQVQSVSKSAKSSSRWTSFVPRWNTQSDDQDKSAPASNVQKNSEASTNTAILLSNAEEELLRDALAL